MSNEKVNMIADLWEMGVGATLETAAKVPESKRLKQLAEGKAHPTWLLGHLVFAANYPVLAIALGKAPDFPQDWVPKFAPDFAGGQPPTSDASNYPSWDELTVTLKKISDTVAAAIRELDDSDLSQPAKGSVPKGMESYFQSLGSALLRFSGHNTYHEGQLALMAALD